MYFYVCNQVYKFWGRKLGILDEKLYVPTREQPEQGNCSGENSLKRVELA